MESYKEQPFKKQSYKKCISNSNFNENYVEYESKEDKDKTILI